MLLQHSRIKEMFGLLSFPRAVPSKGSALPRAIVVSECQVVKVTWGIPDYSAHRDGGISHQVWCHHVFWLKVGRSGTALGVKQWSPPQWVEFVGQNFFVTHGAGVGNSHIHASGWDEPWDVIFYKRLHGGSLGISDESNEEAVGSTCLSF